MEKSSNESSQQSQVIDYYNQEVKQATGYHNEGEMSTTKGYSNKDDASTEPATVKPATLSEPFEIEGQKGQKYRVSPFVTVEQAKAIEQQSGIVLKPVSEQISSFLGGGAYGKVYVAELIGTEKQEFCAVKIITGKLSESEHESDIHLQLTQSIKVPNPQLMPLWDAVKAYEGGKLSCLYYILPLAALGSVADLQALLPGLENVDLKRLLRGHIAKGLFFFSKISLNN